MAKQIARVELDREDWLDIAFALREQSEVNSKPEQFQIRDERAKAVLRNKSQRYIRIAEDIEEQVKRKRF